MAAFRTELCEHYSQPGHRQTQWPSVIDSSKQGRRGKILRVSNLTPRPDRKYGSNINSHALQIVPNGRSIISSDKHRQKKSRRTDSKLR